MDTTADSAETRNIVKRASIAAGAGIYQQGTTFVAAYIAAAWQWLLTPGEREDIRKTSATLATALLNRSTVADR